MQLSLTTSFSRWIPSVMIMVLPVLLISSCHHGRKKPDIRQIHIHQPIQRFERDLMAIDTAHIQEADQALLRKYPSFYPIFLEQIMQFRKPYDTILMVNGQPEKKLLHPDAYLQMLKQFVSHPSIRSLYDTVEKQYADLSFLEKEMDEGFCYFHYYFPKKPTPRLVTFISEFGYSSATIDSSTIIIGLDMYLGRQYRYYDNFFPEYMSRVMEREYIAPTAFRALYQQYFGGTQSSPQLLNQMIERGKELYFLDCVLPDVEDYRKISFTPEQEKWCKENDASLWKFFADHDLFYAQDAFTVNKYLIPGPAAGGMPEEAPGNTGSWLGWQIVRAYAEKTAASPAEIFATDPQRIMARSDYKPSAH